MTEQEYLIDAVEYFRERLFITHIKAASSKHAKLKSYKINPIVVRYLSNILEDGFTPLGVAKALYYPRILGTSINTSFGTNVQKMFIELGLADGSLIKGMDIEFTDKIDDRRKWCQLKSGPNTINSEDVNPLLKKFESVANLGRTNGINLSNSDLIVGVLYGSANQLSQHYQKIDRTYPVLIGADFWHRVTGYADFYDKLVNLLNSEIDLLDTADFFEDGYRRLADEIRDSELFDFS